MISLYSRSGHSKKHVRIKYLNPQPESRSETIITHDGSYCNDTTVTLIFELETDKPTGIHDRLLLVGGVLDHLPITHCQTFTLSNIYQV